MRVEPSLSALVPVSIATASGLVASPGAAHREVLSEDPDSPGDGSVERDTETGLDRFDPYETALSLGAAGDCCA